MRLISSVSVVFLICLALQSTPAFGADQTPAPAPSETILPVPSAPQSESAAANAPVQTVPLLPTGTEFVTEFDPYYTNVSLHIPLTDTPIPELTDINEFKVYRKLFFDSLIPRFMLIEAAVFPMPLVGVGSKKYLPDFYKAFNIGNNNLNLLDSITAGFQEPYALSLFLGDMVSFVKPGEAKIGSNKGYMGYMFSYSNQHIKRNVLIPDNNFEVEWKMKGDRIFRGEKLSWSFRVGAKIHENPNITNMIYLGFRRSNLDFQQSFFSFMNNSSIDFRWDFSAHDGRILRQEYVIGKKFPIKGWNIAFKMDVGVIWEDPAKYTGSLRDNNFQTVTAVLRPNIEW